MIWLSTAGSCFGDLKGLHENWGVALLYRRGFGEKGVWDRLFFGTVLMNSSVERRLYYYRSFIIRAKSRKKGVYHPVCVPGEPTPSVLLKEEGLQGIFAQPRKPDKTDETRG